ncbi:MAG: hypothetical protein NTU53_04835 [Planctomycetota bacterium]|nr:hypothetical protein [Planctomycetota bacterium]
MLFTRRVSSITLPLFAALLVLALWLILQGFLILSRPTAIAAETYHPRVPLHGPYTPEELKLAESQIALFSSTTKPTTVDLENAARSEREMELARQSVWHRRKLQLIQQATQRRPVGRVLIGLGSALLILWTFASYKLWTAR